MLESPDHDAVAGELASVLTARLRASADAWNDAYRVIEELRALGHDLWQFDESPAAFQHWCGDWTGKPRPHEYELIVSFGFGGGEHTGAHVVFQRRKR